MASKNCGSIDFGILSAKAAGSLEPKDEYLVQVNFPAELSSKAPILKTSERALDSMEFGFNKSVKLTSKLNSRSEVIVTLLRHRTLFADEPVANGKLNLWKLWKGKPVQDKVVLKAIPTKDEIKAASDSGSPPKPGKECCSVSVQLAWTNGDVPDLEVDAKQGKTDGGDTAATNLEPGHYEGQSVLADSDSLPSCEGQDYRIHVRIHKARNLQSVKNDKLYDPIVSVTVGDDEQKTDAVSDTNNPIFDEELVFPISKVKNTFWSTPITLQVLDHYLGAINTNIGSAQIDCGTVYRENDEHYARGKWFVLNEDLMSGRVKGFLKCSIAVLNARTDAVPEDDDEEDTEDEDEIVTNLVSGPGARFEKVHLDIGCHRAEGLPKMDFDMGIGNGGTADPYVKAAFGTTHVKTHYIKNTLTPVWNTSIDLPLLLPALTQNLVLSVWDDDAGSADDLIATVRMSMEQLMANGTKPAPTSMRSAGKRTNSGLPRFDTQWMTLYGHPRSVDGFFNHQYKRMAKGEARGCDYRGRLLIGMLGERTEPSAHPPLAVKESLVSFTVLFQTVAVSMVPSGKYVVRISVGNEAAVTGHKASHDMHGDAHFEHLSVDEEVSVTSTLSVVMPEENSQFTVESQLPDVIMHLHPVTLLGGVADEPFAFARFPMAAIWNKPATEQVCVTMETLQDPRKVSSGAEPAQPLAQIAVAAFSVKSDPPLESAPHHETIGMPALPSEEPNKYFVEACVYHAKQLPAGDDNGLSDPYVRIQWANGTAKTGYKLETLSPCFNEMLRCFGDCRKSVTFPDMIVEVWDHDTIGRDTFLGRRVVSIADATEASRVAKPRWYTDFLDSKGRPVPGCNVLLSFELRHATEKILKKLPEQKRFRRKLGDSRETYTGYRISDDKVLPTQPCKIDLDIIGLRQMKTFRLFNLRHPSISVEVGEHRVSLDPIYGANPTFNKTFSVVTDLPTEQEFLPEISFRVYDHRLGTKQLVGCAYMLLSDERCDPARQRDRDSRLNTEIQTRLAKIKSVKEGTPEEPVGVEQVRQRPTFRATAQAIRAVAGANLFADAAVEPVPAQPSVQPRPSGALNEPLLDGAAHPAVAHSPQASTAGLAHEGDDADELQSIDKGDDQDLWFDRFQPEVGTTDIDAAALVSRLGRLRGCGLPPSKTTCEDFFGPFDDYCRLEIRRGWGKDARFAGNILTNATCTPLSAAPGVAIDDDDVPIRDIDRRRPVKILARVYVLLGQKLTAKDSGPFGRSSDPYVKMALTSNSKDAKTIEKKLKESLRKQTLNPEFFVTEDLEGVLPKHNVLRVSIFDYDKLGSDELIGFTDIDLEDRWYSRRGYTGGAKATTLAPGTYTERRTLRDKTGKSAGTLEMWVDLFNTDKEEIPRPIDVQPPPPVAMELRAVIWNTRDVQLVDKSFQDEMMTDIYVRAWLAGLDNDKQQTDVHYRSLDGTGNFNWRMSFDVMFCPRTQQIYEVEKEGLLSAFTIDREPKKWRPVFQVQILDNDLLPGTDDFIGEAQLDLTNLHPARGHRFDQEIGDKVTCLPCGFWPFTTCCRHRQDPRDLTLEQKQALAHEEMLYELEQRRAQCRALAEDKMQPYLDRRREDPAAYSDRFLERLRRKLERDAERELRTNIFKSFLPKKQKKSDDKDADCSPLDLSAPEIVETPKYWFPARAPDGGYRCGDVQISFQMVRKDAMDENDKLAAGKGRSEPNKLPEPDRPPTSFFWLSSPIKTAYYILWRHYKWYIITAVLLIILGIYVYIFLKAGLETKANTFFGAETTKVEIQPAPSP